MTSPSVPPAAEPMSARSPRTNTARSEASDSERATFERLLRNRDSQRTVGPHSELDQAPNTESFSDVWPALGETRTNQSSTQPMQPVVGRAGAMGSDSASVLRQGEHARMAEQPTPLLTGLATDKQGTWQATLPNPGGADWQLRASRETGATPGATGWSVAISSPVAESTMLQRNTARLTERLQERLPGRSVRLTVNNDAAVPGEEGPQPPGGERTADEGDPR